MGGTVEFDHIAPIYDDTRRPPSETEIQALVEVLANCRTVLDAGVGTGRFAVPLQARQFDVLGVDLSFEMMRRARAKGIASLVHADLRHLPLSDQSVDAAFMAHVLQLIPGPEEVLRELGRVARHVVVILLPEWSERGPSSNWRRLRERYRELAAELGYPLPERGKRYRHSLEELSAIAPPKLVRSVEGPAGTAANVSDWLARWEARAPVGNEIPPEVHAEIVRRLEAENPIDPTHWARSRTERFVAWDSVDLRAPTRSERAVT
ncbi:MAG: class I SAM-dependent methyltransferase [Thermoplasmata archaeon]